MYIIYLAIKSYQRRRQTEVIKSVVIMHKLPNSRIAKWYMLTAIVASKTFWPHYNITKMSKNGLKKMEPASSCIAWKPFCRIEALHVPIESSKKLLCVLISERDYLVFNTLLFHVVDCKPSFTSQIEKAKQDNNGTIIASVSIPHYFLLTQP